jgi:MoxR-vWA-beta-propeller ternary system domain bpX2
MSGRWAVRLEHGTALGELRRGAGLEVSEQTDGLWLRGEDEALLRRMLLLPGCRLFSVLGDGQLVPHGARVPRGRLPAGPWQALDRWLTVRLDPAALPGRLLDTVSLRMVPSTIEREANVLLLPLAVWARYAVEAPQVRLQRWTFAVATRLVVLRGLPLPPLPGQHFCEAEGVAMQAGYSWEPAVDATVLCSVLRLEKGDLALLHADGSWDHIRAGDFVAATRAAVRLSVKGPDDER